MNVTALVKANTFMIKISHKVIITLKGVVVTRYANVKIGFKQMQMP